jgi:hypothetical protein
VGVGIAGCCYCFRGSSYFKRRSEYSLFEKLSILIIMALIVIIFVVCFITGYASSYSVTAGINKVLLGIGALFRDALKITPMVATAIDKSLVVVKAAIPSGLGFVANAIGGSISKNTAFFEKLTLAKNNMAQLSTGQVNVLKLADDSQAAALDLVDRATKLKTGTEVLPNIV